MSTSKEENNEETYEQSEQSNILQHTNLLKQSADDLYRLQRSSNVQQSVSRLTNDEQSPIESNTNIQPSHGIADDTKQIDAQQEEVLYDRNHNNKRIHKAIGKQSNNTGPRNTRNLKYKFHYASCYIEKLGDIHDPKWKLQMAHTLSNCSYKRRINGNYDQTVLTFDFKMTKKSVHKVIRININNDLYNIKFYTLWKATKLKSKDHANLFKKNPWFIKYYLKDISTLRVQNQSDGKILRIEWKKHCIKGCVDLKWIKAFNEKATIKFFWNATQRLSNISKDEFDSITPLGEDD